MMVSKKISLEPGYKVFSAKVTALIAGRFKKGLSCGSSYFKQIPVSLLYQINKELEMEKKDVFKEISKKMKREEFDKKSVLPGYYGKKSQEGMVFSNMNKIKNSFFPFLFAALV